MYKVKISKTLKDKYYFWYLYRCFKTLQKRGVIELTEYPVSPFFEEPYYETVFINGYTVFFDVRDDFNVTKKLSNYTKGYTLFKSNFSSELWNGAEANIYPDGFEHCLQTFELAMRPNIVPFMHGRAFKMSYDRNELTMFKDFIQCPIYKVVSMSGAGIKARQTQSRLKTFDLFDSVYKINALLMFTDRAHLEPDEKSMIKNYDSYIKKYPNNINTSGYNKYIEFLSMGDYSINSAGLCLSTPFRFIDSVIANRCVISTKIYHDIYKTSPCIELPICGYFGTGDWEKAKEILKSVSDLGYGKLLQKAKDWYSWYFSVDGMWKNQILANLKGKI